VTEPQRDPRLDNLTERLVGAFEELDFVHSLARVLANPGGMEDLDAYLLEETSHILDADGGWILRATGDGLEVTSSAGLEAGVPGVLTGALVSDLSARGELPFLVDDLHRELMKREAPGIDFERIPRAFVVAPFAAGEEVLGMICLGKREAGRVFSAGDLRLLTTLCSQAFLFIKNADLVSQLKSEARSLGRRLRRLESSAPAEPDLSWIKGRSPSMRSLARQVEGAAATDATILFLGESGTGKSLVARIVHRTGPRRGAPFIEVNCGAVPASLIESELFGHVRGAFTGAARDRQGLFEEADGGTILLDEVAELPLESQVKLLTVLEQRRVRRVGENRDRRVDVRVIAATNADLAASIRAGAFREDLFYRLNVISMTVPPLRERREDILPLARRFLEELSPETHRRVRGISPEAEEALLSYRWPGNVRELRNVVERSLLLAEEGAAIRRDDLPLAPERGSGSGSGVELRSLREAVLGYERALLAEALRQSDGVVARAAARLGITRTNLHNKLRKHNLVRKSHWNDDSH
jgi:transcriptional regulator with GAF, ATPase, and Fis domain